MTGAIERVVVTLDAASENAAAIDTAARLAARAKAPLHGVFVEDEDLINLARLPFTRQTTLGGRTEEFTPEQAELNLRAAAERARRDLLAAARRHGVTASFEIVRGASEAAISGASEHDLVVAGATTRPVAGHFCVGCRWWSSIALATGPFLLAQRAGSAPGGVVLLLRDRGPAAERLFAAAAQHAEVGNATLTVICPPAIAGAAGFDAWIAEQAARGAARVQVEIVPDEPGALEDRIGSLDCRLLAVEASMAEGGAARLRDFIARFACDILIVR